MFNEWIFLDTDPSALESLEEAFNAIKEAIENGEFTVDVLDDFYEIDLNQTDVSGDTVCGPGQTKVRAYCGRFLTYFYRNKTDFGLSYHNLIL